MWLAVILPYVNKLAFSLYCSWQSMSEKATAVDPCLGCQVSGTACCSLNGNINFFLFPFYVLCK